MSLLCFLHPSTLPFQREQQRRTARNTIAMNLSRLGSSDLYVSPICLGTMTWGLQNTQAEAHEQLDYAIKRGVNFIDTAEGYPAPMGWPGSKPGTTEEIIGNYLKQHPHLREKLILASKVTGYELRSAIAANRTQPPPTDLPDCRLDAASVVAACNASLRRLHTSYLDLYQVHWPDRARPSWDHRAYDPSKQRESIPIIETLRGVKQLLDERKIRAYGVSNETTFGVAEYVKAADQLGMPRPVSIQNQFCLFNRSFETELAEACAPVNYNVGLLPYCVLAGGCLTGKYLDVLDGQKAQEADLQKARVFVYQGFMKRFFTKCALDTARKYQAIADEEGVSLTQLAIAFCKSRYFVTSCIIGATNLKQLEQNLDAFEVELSPRALQKIDDVHNENKDFVWRV